MKIAKQEVTLIDHMGSDLSVVNAARVSFDKQSDWEQELYQYATGGQSIMSRDVLSEKDQKLINYLAKHNHWSPFAHTSLQFRIKAPIFVARQLVKHQVGGVWNEVSRRYVDSEPEFYFPDVWRGKPENAKQGSSDVDVTPKYQESLQTSYTPRDRLDAACQRALSAYEDFIDCGMAPEQARMVLPQNTMTEWIWTGSLMFFARVCKLRLDAHAQQETREIAEAITANIPPEFQHSWKALME